MTGSRNRIKERIVLLAKHPKTATYTLATESKSFEPDHAGANLIFHGDDITTGIYSFWSDVYAYDGTLLGSYKLVYL